MEGRQGGHLPETQWVEIPSSASAGDDDAYVQLPESRLSASSPWYEGQIFGEEGFTAAPHGDIGDSEPEAVPVVPLEADGEEGRLISSSTTATCHYGATQTGPLLISDLELQTGGTPSDSEVEAAASAASAAPAAPAVAVAAHQQVATKASSDSLEGTKIKGFSARGNWQSAPQPSPLHGHVLSYVLGLVGDQVQEKANLSLVCKDWKEAMEAPSAWTSLDATHRPLSSLGPYSRRLAHLLSGTEVLSLTEGDSPCAAQLLAQLATAAAGPPLRPGCPAPSPPSEDPSSALAKENDQRRLTAGWRLPRLKRLRVYRRMAPGYVYCAIPDGLMTAIGKTRPRDVSSWSSEAPPCRYEGLQNLEELLLEFEVGSELLLALVGKTPRLRVLVISTLAGEDTAAAPAEAAAAAAAAACREGQSQGEQQQAVTPFEALLLLLQSLPPQQLRVFGVNTPRWLNRHSSCSSKPSCGGRMGGCSAAEAAALQQNLHALRERLQDRRSRGFPQEAEGDELLSLLIERQNEALCALWAPEVEPSLEALDTLQKKALKLNYCSIPGYHVAQLLLRN